MRSCPYCWVIESIDADAGVWSWWANSDLGWIGWTWVFERWLSFLILHLTLISLQEKVLLLFIENRSFLLLCQKDQLRLQRNEILNCKWTLTPLATQGLQFALRQQITPTAILYEHRLAVLFGVNVGDFGLLGEFVESFVAVALEKREETWEVEWGMGGGRGWRLHLDRVAWSPHSQQASRGLRNETRLMDQWR